MKLELATQGWEKGADFWKLKYVQLTQTFGIAFMFLAGYAWITNIWWKWIWTPLAIMFWLPFFSYEKWRKQKRNNNGESRSQELNKKTTKTN